MNCAIYIRVSTLEQAREGYSLAAQKKRLMAFAESQDWTVVGLYPDEGISAKDTNRSELQRMIGDIKSGLIDVVLVYKLDRLTRSVMDLYELLKIFEKHNCKFKSATEVYDTTTAIGRMFITLVAAFAQFERENLGERVRFGMREKVSQGEWHGGTAPFGYDVENGKLVINDREAMIVKKLFDLYVIDGLSDRKTAIELNNLGYLTKQNKTWNEIKVARILKNPVYVGKFQWGRRVNKSDHFTVSGAPRMIPDDLFERTQKLRAARSVVHGRQATSNYYFSGALRCARCGSRLKGAATFHGKQRYKRYRCRKNLYHQCDMPGFSEPMMEKAFIDYIKQYAASELTGTDQEAKQEMAVSSDDDTDKKIKRIHKELDKIENRRKKWQYAWANDAIELEDFTDRMNEEKEREASLHEELKKIDLRNDDQLTYEQIREHLNILENWNSLTDIEKKQYIQIFVEYIIVDREESHHIANRIIIKQIKFR